MKQSDKKYKWASPYEWLWWRINEKNWTDDILAQEVLALASEHDPDTLQDIYQSEMEEDGYFDEVEDKINAILG